MTKDIEKEAKVDNKISKDKNNNLNLGRKILL